MRLLHTNTLTLHEFYSDRTPLYGILSHTWGDDELSYQDLLNLNDAIRAKSGYVKMVGFAAQCKERGLEYCWIDTCCIDKSSSAELSEAINSMYQWYKDAEICIVYLSDVEAPEVPGGTDAERPLSPPPAELSAAFRASKWFTRGWTLQELIAPRILVFYEKGWNGLLVTPQTLSNITGIPLAVLNVGLTDDISVAQKMFWASARKTTRIEDIAYCLLGIFGVNMPLLYGEGENAFLRLQEEIIRRSDDETIFLWIDDKADSHSIRSLFARHPSEFKLCRNTVRVESMGTQPLPYTLTNTGLQMNLRLLPSNPSRKEPIRVWPFNTVDTFEGDYIPALHCQDRLTKSMRSIYLKRLKRDGQQYARVMPFMTVEIPLGPEDPNLAKIPLRQIYIRQTIRTLDLSPSEPIWGFQFVNIPPGILLSGRDHWLSTWEGDILLPIPRVYPQRAITFVDVPANLGQSFYLVVGLRSSSKAKETIGGDLLWYAAFLDFEGASTRLDIESTDRESQSHPLPGSSRVILKDRIIAKCHLPGKMFPYLWRKGNDSSNSQTRNRGESVRTRVIS